MPNVIRINRLFWEEEEEIKQKNAAFGARPNYTHDNDQIKNPQSKRVAIFFSIRVCLFLCFGFPIFHLLQVIE